MMAVAPLNLPPLLPLRTKARTRRSAHGAPPLGDQLVESKERLLQPLPGDRAAGK